MAAVGDVRTVATVYVVLGLATACFALYAISLDPATFGQLHLQEMDLQQPEQGLMTAVEMRAAAVVLLLCAVGQALAAMAVIAGTGRLGIVCVLFQSIPIAWRLPEVLAGVVNVAIGPCTGAYRHELSVCYFHITASYGILFVYGLLVVIRRQDTVDR